MGKEAIVWDLVAEWGRERSEGGGESGRKVIHLQAPSDGGTVGGPPAYIGILRAVDEGMREGGGYGPHGGGIRRRMPN